MWSCLTFGMRFVKLGVNVLASEATFMFRGFRGRCTSRRGTNAKEWSSAFLEGLHDRTEQNRLHTTLY